MQHVQLHHDRKALVRQFVDLVINQGRLDILDDVLAPIAQPDSFSDGGSERIKTLIEVYREAIPDAQWTIEQQFAEGDTVVTCFIASGTHRGPLLGLAPTGRRMALHGILFSHCTVTSIVAQWAHVDRLELLQQLGVMPALALDKAVAVARFWRAYDMWTQRAAGDARGHPAGTIVP